MQLQIYEKKENVYIRKKVQLPEEELGQQHGHLLLSLDYGPYETTTATATRTSKEQ